MHALRDHSCVCAGYNRFCATGVVTVHTVTPHCCSVPICLDVCVCLDAWIISDSFLTHDCLTCGWGEACLGYGRGVEGVGPRLSGADADVSSTEEASGSRLLATSAASPLAESLSTQHRLCAVYSFFMLRIEVHASYVKSLQWFRLTSPLSSSRPSSWRTSTLSPAPLLL